MKKSHCKIPEDVKELIYVKAKEKVSSDPEFKDLVCIRDLELSIRLTLDICLETGDVVSVRVFAD